MLSILQALTIGDFFSELGQVANRREGWTVHPQIQHVQSCTAWSHCITRTRVAQELQNSVFHIFVSHQHKQDLWSSTHIYPAMFHGRVADQHTSHLAHKTCPRFGPDLAPRRGPERNSTRSLQNGTEITDCVRWCSKACTRIAIRTSGSWHWIKIWLAVVWRSRL